MQDTPTPLFRAAAVAAQHDDGCGAIVLARPPSFAVLCALCVAVAAGLLSFAYLGSYTAHSTLRGRVVPERGVIEIAGPQGGTIVEKRAREGARVAAGDVLFVVSSERLTAGGAAAQEAIGAQLAKRRTSLAAQIAGTLELERAERAVLKDRLAALRREQDSVAEMLAAAHERLRLASAARERHARLRALGFLAEEQWQLREVELLERRADVKALERERAGIARIGAELDGRTATLALEYANTRAELEIVENEARRAIVIAAPEPGVVTGVVGEAGHAVERGTVLARLVPAGSTLVAELVAPSRAIGFIAPGAAVRLRYAAFPYEKFGHAHGVVATLSQATLAPAEALPRAVTPRAEPVYRVIVTLESQTVAAYGVPRHLLPGMEVEADVLLETRRLYEWVLEPLYALAGRAR